VKDLGDDDNFIIHGLWPSYQSGKYMQDCNNEEEIYIDLNNQTSDEIVNLCPGLYSKSDISFWRHEYNKHRYCYIKRIGKDPKKDYNIYFEKTISIFKDYRNLMEEILPDIIYGLNNITKSKFKKLFSSSSLKINDSFYNIKYSYNNETIVLAAFIGSFLVLAILLFLGRIVRSQVTLLITGIPLSYLTCDIITLLGYYASAQGFQQLMLWVVQHLMRQIIEAFKYIHGKNIIHRDIKLENILLNYENEEDRKNLNKMKANVKIIDFGFAAKMEKAGLKYTTLGSPINMDPIILNELQKKGKKTRKLGYDQKADI